MPTLDFDAARRERGRGEPLRFKLGGKTFTCVPMAPFAWVGDAVTKDQDVTVLQRFEQACQFVRDVLATDADRKRFDGVLRSFDDPITEQDVLDVVNGLVAVYAARPTLPPNGSSNGRRRTGARSSNGGSGRSRAKA